MNIIMENKGLVKGFLKSVLKREYNHKIVMSTHKKKENLTSALAAYFLGIPINEKIDSVRRLSDQFHASIGLISETISDLEENGALSIVRRGQLGSILSAVDVGKLWHFSVEDPLVIAQTLPSNRRYSGLAAALKQLFTQAGIETYFSFIRGSRTRISALHQDRCHIAITSLFAANGLADNRQDIAYTFPNGSFVKSHQVFYRTHAIREKKKNIIVGFDPDSYDQYELSKLEFPENKYTYKNITFMNIFDYLKSSQIDIAIWTEEDMAAHIGKTVQCRPISQKTRDETLRDDTKAALVINHKNQLIKNVIQRVVNTEEIMRIQKAIIAGDVIPEY